MWAHKFISGWAHPDSCILSYNTSIRWIYFLACACREDRLVVKGFTRFEFYLIIKYITRRRCSYLSTLYFYKNICTIDSCMYVLSDAQPPLSGYHWFDWFDLIYSLNSGQSAGAVLPCQSGKYNTTYMYSYKYNATYTLNTTQHTQYKYNTTYTL